MTAHGRFLPVAVHNGVSAMGVNSYGLGLSGHDPGRSINFRVSYLYPLQARSEVARQTGIGTSNEPSLRRHVEMHVFQNAHPESFGGAYSGRPKGPPFVPQRLLHNWLSIGSNR